MIEVRDLLVRRGAFSLANLNVHVDEGSSFALLGPSGSGKTLLLETVLGLQVPDSGTVEIEGRNVHTLAPEERSVAFLPQDLALFPHLSVFENIAFCLNISREQTDEEVAGLVKELAEQLGIAHLLQRSSIAHLSGGEQQRVALARALIGKPRLLFLDEPFCALDGARRRDLHRQVRTIQQKLGLTMFFVTHDLDEALVMADHVAIMRRGTIEQQGPPAHLFDNPTSSWAAHFLLFENVFPATVSPHGDISLGDVSLQAPRGKVEVDECHWCAVRAEALHLDQRFPKANCSFTARAKEPLLFGSKRVLPVQVGANGHSREFLVALDATWPPEGQLIEAGAEVTIRYDANDINILERSGGQAS